MGVASFLVGFGLVLVGCGGAVEDEPPIDAPDASSAAEDEACERAPSLDVTCRQGVAWDCPDRVRCRAPAGP